MTSYGYESLSTPGECYLLICSTFGPQIHVMYVGYCGSRLKL